MNVVIVIYNIVYIYANIHIYIVLCRHAKTHPHVTKCNDTHTDARNHTHHYNMHRVSLI